MGLQIDDREATRIHDWSFRRDALAQLPDRPANAEASRRLETGPRQDPRVAERIDLGRDTTQAAVLNRSDKCGTPRLRLAVDSRSGRGSRPEGRPARRR